jgi:hypothetical protein
MVDLPFLILGGGTFLVAIVLWLDNAQGGVTGNGVFKSLQLKPWVASPANARIDPSNFLFFPVYGAGCRLLDLLGVFVGDPRRQMTILNAASASLLLGLVYTFVRMVTGDRLIALAAALFHISCNGVLFLAIINEDIMPSYTVMFAAMALAALVFAEPTARRVVMVSFLFSLGWLFEWRLMFPTLPAMLLALWLCEKRLLQRLAWIALFLLAMLAIASGAALVSRGHPNAVGPLQLLWTGKAVVSAWSGFSWTKAFYLTDGISAYLLGTRLTTLPGLPGWDLWRLLAIGSEFAIAAVASTILWRSRKDPRSRSLIAVFGGTLLAGQVFNLYAQPNDPQMQINVMAWLTVACSLILVQLRSDHRSIFCFAGLSASLLVYNLWSLAPERGLDTAWKHAIARLEQKIDPTRTVFVVHDFDWAATYLAAVWGDLDIDIDRLGPAPQVGHKFKRIGIITGMLYHPERSDQEQIDVLRAQLDQVLSLGYDVLALHLWDADQYFLDQLSATVVRPAELQAVMAMLRRDFAATEIVEDPIMGKVYRLRSTTGR